MAELLTQSRSLVPLVTLKKAQQMMDSLGIDVYMNKNIFFLESQWRLGEWKSITC